MGNSNSRRRSHNDHQTTLTPSAGNDPLSNFTGPTGLYPTCEWDQKNITRLILDKKLAPRHKGTQVEQTGSEECPICFLNYTAFNNVNCCNNYICTECYLQLKAPKGVSTCPFCNNTNFGATFNPGQRRISSNSVTTSPSSPPSNNSSPIPQSTPSPASDSSKSMSKSPSVMSAEARRQLEREMAVQRADHITSEQYVESRYRSNSWGSRNDAPPPPSSRRNTLGPRAFLRRDRGERSRRENHREELRSLESRMRSMGLHDFDFDGNEEEHGYYDRSARNGAPNRVSPSIHDEILAESRIQIPDDTFGGGGDEGGRNLQQLEEMMIREAIRLSMSENANEMSRNTPLQSSPERMTAQPAPLLPSTPIATTSRTTTENIEHRHFNEREQEEVENDDDDDEEAMLEYALTLSRQLALPNPAPSNHSSNEGVRTSDVGISLQNNHNRPVESPDRTLSPSALRLLDLIEEALSIPGPASGGESDSSSEVHQSALSFSSTSSDEPY